MKKHRGFVSGKQMHGFDVVKKKHVSRHVVPHPQCLSVQIHQIDPFLLVPWFKH